MSAFDPKRTSGLTVSEAGCAISPSPALGRKVLALVFAQGVFSGGHLQRREFITLIGGVAAAWPLAASGQQPMPVVGFLNGASPTELESRVVAFRDGLAEKGYVEGHSVAIEYRWGLGQYERLPEMAVDLVRHRAAVIAATGGLPSVRAAKTATSEIPIVFTMGGDPVAFGLVASLNRPGGNVTGITLVSGEIVSKRIALLRDLLPGTRCSVFS